MKNLSLILISLLFTGSISAQSSILGREFAHEAAEQLMKKISPNTGDDASASINEIEYDYDSNRYIIDMTAQWTAQRTWLDDEETFIVRGILKVGKNGQNPSFKETYRNEAVKQAWSFDDVVGGVIILVTLAEAVND